MSDRLREIQVLALDCQAAGATPAYGDLLELGWAVVGTNGTLGGVQSHWILPRTGRRVARAVRELTGWSEACIAQAVHEEQAWAALREDIARVAELSEPPRARSVIHFARFELGFLRDLHERVEESPDFPLDAICLHAIAWRLFPDLPRRNLRALAGYLGHSPELVRRSAGHVAATAFIWQSVVPLLEDAGVHTWQDLKRWLDEKRPEPRPSRRVYPLARERRRSLPDDCGVYRFLRKNGDVVYIGKATSLRRRVASHFKARGPATERTLELLTQVHDIHHTRTASLLEAALLETDEIKRLDPPYNVQLRTGDRYAWFASRDLRHAVPAPDDAHPIGPLPSERALSPLSALLALAQGADASPHLRAMSLAVPKAFLPEPELFDQGFQAFSADYLSGDEPSAMRRVLCASRALYVQRGRADADAGNEESAPDEWDFARVRRRLERNLVQTGLLLRRTRWLCLLAESAVAFRERSMSSARCLVFSRAELVERHDLADVTAVRDLAVPVRRTLAERRASFDASAYDRVRVLLTELRRVQDDGGDVAVRAGGHTIAGERLARLLRAV